MATREVVVLVCDGCGRAGDDVETHELGWDRRRVQVETCAKCRSRVAKVLDPLLGAGRRVPRR